MAFSLNGIVPACMYVYNEISSMCLEADFWWRVALGGGGDQSSHAIIFNWPRLRHIFNALSKCFMFWERPTDSSNQNFRHLSLKLMLSLLKTTLGLHCCKGHAPQPPSMRAFSLGFMEGKFSSSQQHSKATNGVGICFVKLLTIF